MSTGLELMTILEKAGGSLILDGEQVKVTYPPKKRGLVTPILTRLRDHRAEIRRILQERSRGSAVLKKPATLPGTTTVQDLPIEAILVAPRYGNSPLEKVPHCWCCGTSYCLEKTQQSEGKAYAWLKPGCKCLDTPQAIKCCGLCTGHCTCKTRQEGNNCPEVSSK